MSGWRYYAHRTKVRLLPNWSGIRTATTSRAITSLFIFTSLIPIVAKILTAVGQLCVRFHVGQLCVPFALPFSAHLLFTAGVCGIAATAIYAVRCPPWIKQFRNVCDFGDTGMDSTELFEQSNRFFDSEYVMEAIPRFLVFNRLMHYDRIIEPIHDDFDEHFRHVMARAANPRAHGIETDASTVDLLTSFPFIKRVIASRVSGEPHFNGTPREFAAASPERYFWKMHRLQDESRPLSRTACAILLQIAYICLGLILLQNTWTMWRYWWT